jgi:hypothetical protein
MDMIKTLPKEEMKPGDLWIERAIIKALENENEELDEKSNLSICWLNSEQPWYPPKYEHIILEQNYGPKPLDLEEFPTHLKYIFLG